jgi:hypothetical protein
LCDSSGHFVSPRKLVWLCSALAAAMRPEDQERTLSMGLRDLILKPDTIEQLARTLDQVFQLAPASVAIPAKPLKG